MMKTMGICLLMAILMTMLMGCGGNPTASSNGSATITTTTTATTTTTTQSESVNALTLIGRVTEVVEADQAVLMECIGDCPLGDRVWVQYGRITNLNPQIGETYTVTYEDMVMPSLPPRITAVTMTLTE